MKTALCLVLAISFSPLLAQRKERPLHEQMPTENLESRKDSNKSSNQSKRKRIALLYVKDADKILYGNPCATEETHRMGFEYIVEPKSRLRSKSKVGKFFNNFLVKAKLVVTRSPLWKAILNKRMRSCRQKTGDFVG